MVTPTTNILGSQGIINSVNPYTEYLTEEGG